MFKTALLKSLLCTIFLSVFCAKDKAQSGEMAWLLNQTNPSSPYSKSQTVILSKRGVKVLGPEVRLIIPAPQFKISVFNDSTRQYYDASPESWMKKYGARPLKQTGKYIRKTGKGKVAGIEADIYALCIKEYGKERILRLFWTTSKLRYPQRLQDILLALCGLPKGYGVPLKVVRIFPDRTQEAIVNTLFAKTVPLKSDTYTLPKNYKRVESELALLMDFGKETELESHLSR